MTHPIPDAALRETGAIIGRTGSGKTYAAKGIVERMLEAKARICIIDPTGAWWGLRASADGEKPGFPVIVFGGDRADVKLTEGMGAPLAEQLGVQNLPAIVDVSDFTMAGRIRFVTTFLDRLYHVNKVPLTLVIDEADMFAPQRPGKDELTLLSRMEQICRRGRIKGFRPWLITQRPASLHKAVLSQANTLVAMQLTAPQDRDALGAWIEGQADKTKGKEILAELPKLKRGEGFVWAPHHEILTRVKFPPIATFDSSRSPEDGVAAPPVKLAKVDLTTLSGILIDQAEPDDEDDNEALRARVKELEQQLETAGAPDPEALQAEYRRGLRKGVAEAWTAEWPALERLRGTLADAILAIDNFGQKVADSRDADESAPIVSRDYPEGIQRASAPAKRGEESGKIHTKPGDLPAGERAVLTAIAQHRRGVTREQLTILTGYKRSTRNLYLQQLAKRELVREEGEQLHATPAGLATLGPNFRWCLTFTFCGA